MFIGAGAWACCADAMALEAKIARATAAGPRQRVQILADQHVIATTSPAVRGDEAPEWSDLRREGSGDHLKSS
jgi:hypothetical protein